MVEVGQTGARFGSPKQRRRWHQETDEEPVEPLPVPRPEVGLTGARFHGVRQEEPEPEPEPVVEVEPEPEQLTEPLPELVFDDGEEPSALVRPYARTGGRTVSRYELRLETLVSAGVQRQVLGMEHQAIVDLCAESKSVAEVAAMLVAPLGVARVLLSDLISMGLLHVHDNSGEQPDLAVLERVLAGLRRL